MKTSEKRKFSFKNIETAQLQETIRSSINNFMGQDCEIEIRALAYGDLLGVNQKQQTTSFETMTIKLLIKREISADESYNKFRQA